MSGTPGSGKNTIADMLAKKLKLKRYSMGDLRGKMALERGITLDELNKLGEKEEFTDKEIDDYQKKLGEKEDNFIIDGRLSFYFIPQSIKIYLDVNPTEGARRIFIAPPRKDEQKYNNLNDVIKANQERIESDKKRYRKYYNLDSYDKKHYDFVVDTTKLRTQEITNKILKFLKEKGYI